MYFIFIDHQFNEGKAVILELGSNSHLRILGLVSCDYSDWELEDNSIIVEDRK